MTLETAPYRWGFHGERYASRPRDQIQPLVYGWLSNALYPTTRRPPSLNPASPACRRVTDTPNSLRESDSSLTLFDGPSTAGKTL